MTLSNDADVFVEVAKLSAHAHEAFFIRIIDIINTWRSMFDTHYMVAAVLQ